MGKKKVRTHNLVADTPPFYAYNNMTISTTTGTDTIDILEYESYNGRVDGWQFESTFSATSMQTTCWYRKKFDLGGIYDQYHVLYPIGNVCQQAEPPLWPSDLANNKYMREVEIWSTRELNRHEVKACVNYAIPTLPSFAGSPSGPDAFMDDPQVIAGRSRMYSGTASFSAELGFGVMLHENIIGQGEPIASPELHYVRAYYLWFQRLDGRIGQPPICRPPSDEGYTVRH